MKRFIVFAIAFLMFVSTIFCMFAFADSQISLYLDGERLKSDVAPIIVNDRTLVPIRCIFEKISAKVNWVADTKQVVIDSADKRILLTIDSKSAYINNKEYRLDAAPIIVNDRTMIPVRFITEALEYEVSWEESTKSVNIKSPQKIVQTVVNSVTVSKSGSVRVVKIKCDNFKKPDIITASNPTRYILDFDGATLAGKDSKINVGDNNITEVRWAVHEDYVRVVIESPEKATYKVDYGDGYMNITVTGNVTHKNEDTYTPPQVSTKPKDKITVVIDPGHGGKDVGAVGYNKDGVAEVYEAQANLKIALKVKSYLEAAGVNVIMTRSKDVALGSTEMADLVERCRIANDADADLYVSIHNNSISNPEISGTMILYTSNSSSAYNGVSSYDLAKSIMTPLLKATGIPDMGLRDSPNMVVLRKTVMPSVLIEVAFVTCENDRAILNNESKIDAIAKAIADGIVNVKVKIK